MEFDSKSRMKLRKEYYENWQKENCRAIGKVDAEQMEGTVGIGGYYYSDDQYFRTIVQKARRKKEYDRFSDLIKDALGNLAAVWIPSRFRMDYDSIVDEFPTFQYTRGYDRRSFRTRDFSCHIRHAVRLMYSYMYFGIFGGSVSDFLRERMPEELIDLKRNGTNVYGEYFIPCLDDIIAARINAGDQGVIDAVKDSILSENNTVLVTREIIRAIVKCKNEELHVLLGEFLVAARLSEGIRQAVCESADEGRIDSFLTLLRVIRQEDLTRFSAVKRAIGTWTGFIDTENADRIIAKILPDMITALEDPEAAKQLLQTDDSIRIMLGLWAIAAREVEGAMEAAKTIAVVGSKVQKLTVSYFNTQLQNNRFTQNIAATVVENNAGDGELIAAFLPTYLENAGYTASNTWKITDGSPEYQNDDAKYEYRKLLPSDLFEDDLTGSIARKHYGILKQNLAKLKKKKVEYRPLVFPWYGVMVTRGDLVTRMAVIACALEDNTFIDEVCALLSDIDAGWSGRAQYVRLLLHDPQTEDQRKTLVGCLADRDSETRRTAYRILKHLTLTREEYQTIAGYLKYKADDLRKYVLMILKQQPGAVLAGQIRWMLTSGNENMRLAAFDLIRTEYADDRGNAARLLTESGIGDSLSEREKVLWDEILCPTERAGRAQGFGLYDPGMPEEVVLKPAEDRSDVVRAYFSVTDRELDRIFTELNGFLKEHETLEYKDWSGETCLLGNGLYMCSRYDHNRRISDCYPFRELWQEFYDRHVKSGQLLMNMYIAMLPGYTESSIKDYRKYLSLEKKLLPFAGSDYHFPDGEQDPIYWNDRKLTVIRIMKDLSGAEIPPDVAAAACEYMSLIPKNMRWLDIPEEEVLYYRYGRKCSFTGTEKMKFFINAVREDSRKDFASAFRVLRRLDITYGYQNNPDAGGYDRTVRKNRLGTYPFIYACTKGLISKEFLWKYLLEELPPEVSAKELNAFVKTETGYEYEMLSYYVEVDADAKKVDKDNDFFRFGVECYRTLEKLILDMELKRGDSETELTQAGLQLRQIFGTDRLGQILAALGKDTLDRNTYYSSRGAGKRASLSSLLQICYPGKGETAEDLGKLHTSDERLIEVAMYAPQWTELIEKTLNYDGLTSGCYYFMAHMNERFDDRKKAMIAKYTPLSEDELNEGCMDLEWFKEAYQKLGDDMFGRLYQAAKYISDGSKYARARKYADAALGRVDRDVLEREISEKRNKDLLMSLGLIPLEDEKDCLQRYEFIQKFRKESRQFGALRRASEQKACDTALKNLASAAGYSDSLRLVLAMETALVSENNAYFNDTAVNDCIFRVSVSEEGKAELTVRRKGKLLKSVPGEFKKNETVLDMKEFTAKLCSQYSRSVNMFENSMEEREQYSEKELLGLIRNPVLRGILSRLIFVRDGVFYALSPDGEFSVLNGILETVDSSDSAVSGANRETPAEGQQKPPAMLRVAHPYDMYVSKRWPQLQRLIFDRARNDRKYQPFKQVFRELYVKLPEEEDQTMSRMFAGNQIQPQKTVAALKGRKWIADYEDGLQKIYYKDNIIATIYAAADWFSPSDTEAPTLEYVAFYHRKTFEQIKISGIPPIIYSEVMRDVDLAVSIAHAGGVDPETSHSAIELRKAVIGLNLDLFRLSNVRMEGTHALVKGAYGDYSIHLGSGVIHKLPGIAVHVLPVHSQQRGRIFLPFIDEDPKTAEILSKIILFAEDKKIKDPSILQQIIF